MSRHPIAHKTRVRKRIKKHVTHHGNRAVATDQRRELIEIKLPNFTSNTKHLALRIRFYVLLQSCSKAVLMKSKFTSELIFFHPSHHLPPGTEKANPRPKSRGYVLRLLGADHG